LCNYYVQFHLLYNTQIPNADRIYKLYTELAESDLRKEFPEIEKIFSTSSSGIYASKVNYSINIEDKDVSLQGFLSDVLDSSFIDFFSLPVVHGTREMISRTVNGVVLFESFAKKLTGDTNSLIGKELKLEDNRAFPITGILKDQPENSLFGNLKDIYFLFGRKSDSKPTVFFFEYKQSHTYYLQLNKSVSKRNFVNKVEHYFNKDKKEGEAESQYVLKPFTGLSNFSEYTINIGKFLFIFGLLILFATLFNFILFQFSMYYNRFNEYGLRIVNGMTGWQFTLQLFVDIMVRFLISGLIAFFIMDAFFHFFEKMYYDLTYIRLSLPLLMEHLIKYILYGAVLSFVLSYILSRGLLKRSLRSVSGYIMRRNNRNMGRNILLLLQLVVMIIFISAAGIVKFQADSMKKSIFSNLTPNERENILSFYCNYPQLGGKFDILSQKISNSSQVLDVTRSDQDVIGMMWSGGNLKIKGIEGQTVRKYVIAPNCFDFFNGHIIQGSTFEDTFDYAAVVVNKNFMKLFPDESIIGKTFTYEFDNKTYKIIGIVDNIQIFLKDFNNNGVEEANNIVQSDALFFPLLPKWQSGCCFYVKCQQGKTKEVKKHIETCLKEFIPESYQVEFETLQDKIDETFSAEKLIEYSSVVLFLICLILGLLSIYSSVLMSVEKKRKEIAIRKINGAGIKDIMLLFGKTYFILWNLACLISFPFIYFYATRWLERYKEPITLNIMLFVMIYIVILAFIALIVFSRIITTAKTNPAEVVKKE